MSIERYGVADVKDEASEHMREMTALPQASPGSIFCGVTHRTRLNSVSPIAVLLLDFCT